MSNSKKQVTVIIGGTSGLGLSIAAAFISEDMDVILGSRSLEKQNTAKDILNHNVQCLNIDITDQSSVEEFFKKVGDFNHLIVTASNSFMDRPLNETSIDELKLFSETKLWGAIRCVKEAVKYISDGGSISFISGAVSKKGRAGAHAKTITNSALEGITRSLAVEFGPKIRVNCISPGIFDSKGTMTEQKKQEIRQMYPAKYVGISNDVALIVKAAVLNPFMTGSVIYIDGGWTSA